ncbi:MAG: maleylpyruvate isomerase family mycothiol-dependent enzyme [Acidimicrobiales bacterium]
MTPSEHLAELRDQAGALARRAAGSEDHEVRACPGWTTADLVRHLGATHRWARAIVASGERADYPDVDDGGDLVGWFVRGADELVATCAGTDPDRNVWTFAASRDRRASWWFRRQALETAVHRFDLDDAVGAAMPLPAALAVDGIDEYLADLLPRVLSRRPVEGVGGTLHLHCTDAAGEWWLDLDAAGAAGTGASSGLRREHAKADTAVRGAASDLYLWLWNRVRADDAALEVFGRRELAGAWTGVRL